MSDHWIRLTAGPLGLHFDPATGWVRYVRLGGREVLRAIYPAVRDPYWNTPPWDVSGLVVEPAADGFRVSFDAAVRRGPIDYALRAAITGTADGTVAYHFDGASRSAFRRNRIGLCVLHPIAGCSGKPCEVEHADGSVEHAAFPSAISPHQPFHDVRAIRHLVVPGATAEVRFDGDVFETEDQRNWTDASFKTYSTPLALPFPAAVNPGDAVRQSVTLRVRTDAGFRPPSMAVQPATVAFGGERRPRLPRIGFGFADETDADLIRPLRPHHLRVDVATDSLDADLLRRAAAFAAAVGAGLEVGLMFGPDPEAELAALAVAVPPGVVAWLVFRGQKGPATADDVAAVRRHLGPAAVGVGSNVYFTEVNRQRPPVAAADLLAFPVNPQVHAFDDVSVVEALDGQSEVVAAAAGLAGGRPVAVTPITLRPRFNPNGESADDPWDAHDPRLATPFAAAWAIGSVRRLALAGVDRVTYFATTGPHGVTDGGRPRPVYRVFEALAGFNGEIDLCRCSRPLEVEAIRCGAVVLVANLTARTQQVQVCDAGGEPVRGNVALGPYEVTRLG